MLTDFNFKIYEIHNCGSPTVSIIQLLVLYIPRRTLGVAIIFLLNMLGDITENLTWLNMKLPKLATNYFIVAKKIDQY